MQDVDARHRAGHDSREASVAQHVPVTFMTNKIDVRPEWWDNVFAPSSCLVIITTADKDGRVNAAAFGTCTRVCHDPMYISFTCGSGKDTYDNVLATGEFVVNVVPFEQTMLDKTLVCGLPFRAGENELIKAALPPIPPRTPTPWGLRSTLGWVILAFALAAGAGLVVLLIWRPDAIMSGGADMLKDGPLISITTVASAVVQVGMLALAAKLARWPAGEYLGLVRPAMRPALIAIAIMIVFLLGYDALTYLI